LHDTIRKKVTGPRPAAAPSRQRTPALPPTPTSARWHHSRHLASNLQTVEDTVLPSYVEGLRAEGRDIPLDVVRRAHALHLMLLTGLSTLPFEHLGTDPTPALHHMATDRATIARFALDLLEATDPTRRHLNTPMAHSPAT